MAKIRLNLNQPVMDLSADEGAEDGLKPTDQKLSHTLGTMLKTSPEGDALKYLCWAIDLYKDGGIEVDQADFDHLQTFIKNNKTAWALVRGQLLQVMNAAKEASTKPAEAKPA
ncbi:MAG: hypothetical protein M1608_17380 [Candidatus Omnitrophica bacterium]|nr:hypothetical protein [Candidatus Omnitrophota bacterium]